MTQDLSLPPAIRYVPLLPRARPPALPLRQRIKELHDLARAAATAEDPTEGLIKASEAMNKAALIASDTGQPVLAERLCWEHHDLFAPAAPLPVRAATLALQPLVNLGRLAIRADQFDDAHQTFDALFAAMTHGRTAVVQGRTCAVADLVASPPERAELRRFLWTVLLADGTRALCQAGRWQEALAHLSHHHGIGHRLLDGRQVAVVAALHRHEPDTTHTLLEEASCSAPWEQAVAACLATAAARARGHDPTDAIAAMTDAILNLPPIPGGTVFTTRVGTLACELAPHHHALADHLIHGVIDSDDAYAVATVLSSPAVETHLSPRQRETLRARVNHAKLNRTSLSSSLTQDLALVSEDAAAHLTRHLKRMLTHPAS
ncbi:hypothetical protein KIK06_15060 [Nocardiopsis sp. EMB25]|uniref:hypothetical protein n=1 Tax=Nocardiopsis sp. EMB25 TaxID=2835867 RepID=UPI002283652A|nr:hypothetical protein [Nocardiopsis sp. EMB25]MCY9785202.1 hypothetical protein [Nocardiopsis sp. EMB25]